MDPEPIAEARLQPHPLRLPPDTPGYDEIIRRHHEAVRRGEAGYTDPASGLWVMTATSLWERGSCCESGCRHCPWLER